MNNYLIQLYFSFWSLSRKLRCVFLLLLFLGSVPVASFASQHGTEKTASVQEEFVPCFRNYYDYKKGIPEMARVAYEELYAANIDFIKYGLANYYNSEDKSNGKRIRDVKKFYDKRGSKAYGIEIDAHFQGGWYQLASVHAKTKMDKKKLAELGQLPEYDPNYNGAVARSELWCDYQEEYNGRIYEYWLMMQSSIAKACLYCEFLVTEAQSKGGERKIIHRANQFFRTYQVDDKFSVIFPDDAYRKRRTSYGFCPNCPK